MSTISHEEVERIVKEHKARKIKGDMLDAAGAVDSLLGYEQAQGIETPWAPLQGKFSLRPGELTLVGGENKSGKSMLTGQIAAWAMTNGYRSFIASFEMRPRETVRRMLSQCAGGPWSREFAQWWGGEYRELLWLWDIIDKVNSDRVLERIEAVTQYLDADLVVVDSLLKCGLPPGNDKNGAQGDFVDRLQNAAKALNVHIMLVVHFRKPESGQRISRYNIRGASEISDLADNVFLVVPNDHKREAEQLLEIGAHLTREQEQSLSEADALFVVDKQRHGEWEGKVKMDFHKSSLQFRPAGQFGRYEWPGSQGAPL